jgi:Protein of unknown function (DUF1579)
MKKIATFVISGAALSFATLALAADKPVEKPAAPAATKAAAAPAPAAPAAMPAPSPEIDALFKGYEGNWKCDTTFAAGAFGPGSAEVKTKSEVKIKKELGGYWYKGDFKIKKQKTMPAMEGMFILGYDTATKKAITSLYDSMGGFAHETATTATPEKIVFEGDNHTMGMKAKVKETMTKKSDKEIEHTFDIDLGKGYAPMGTDVCKK